STAKVNAAKLSAVSAARINAVKPSAVTAGNPQQSLKDKGVIDSGCSRHMTGNMSYLSDFEELNGGYVAFGGNPKGGKIIGKGNIKTGKLDFDDVYCYLLNTSTNPSQIQTPHGHNKPNTTRKHTRQMKLTTTIDGRNKMKKHGRNIRLRSKMEG
nr:ribonuclease H-like domain-containing protein [Tanacetum cinerariifolium]